MSIWKFDSLIVHYFKAASSHFAPICRIEPTSFERLASAVRGRNRFGRGLSGQNVLSRGRLERAPSILGSARHRSGVAGNDNLCRHTQHRIPLLEDERSYGIPPEQVIGSRIEASLKMKHRKKRLVFA